MKQDAKGFSLIELMIIVAIIGVLTAIAFPSYNNYIMQSRRSDAVAMLLQVMQQQERYFTERLSYTTDLTQLGYTLPVRSDGENYEITASTCATGAISQCVLLTATALGGQAADGNLTINSRGARTPVGFWR